MNALKSVPLYAWILVLGFVLTGLGSALAWLDGKEKERESESKGNKNNEIILGLQQDLLKSKEETIRAITGGDSYCSAHLLVLPPSTDDFGLAFVHNGKYPLYDLRARIVDVEAVLHGSGARAEGKILDIGNMAPGSSVTGPGIKLNGASGSISLNIFFTARNGEFTELLRVRKVGGDWVVATKVTAPSTPPDHVVKITADGELQIPPDKVLFESIHPNFPRNPQGQVEW